MMPAATGEMNEWWRNSSRLWTFEMWHSITGRLAPSMASCNATEVWVNAPGLKTAPIAPPGLDLRPELVDPVDERALVVGLPELHVQPELAPLLPAHRLDVGERGAPVHLGFAGAEQVEVGPVEHEDGGHGCIVPVRQTPAARRRSYSSRGIGLASGLPRSFRWIRNVSRALYAAMAAMIASPNVMLPTVQTTFISIRRQPRQVTPLAP